MIKSEILEVDVAYWILYSFLACSVDGNVLFQIHSALTRSPAITKRSTSLDTGC